jgi:membrane protein implicated in regulation of membrane protease activity
MRLVLSIMLRVPNVQTLAVASIVVSTIFVVWLGVMSTSANSQPSKAQAVLLVVLAAVFQLAGNYALSRKWTPHPQVRRQAVDQLNEVRRLVENMKNVVELAVDNPSTKNARKVLGESSVLLDVVWNQLALSVKSWDNDGSSSGAEKVAVEHGTD